MAPPSPIFNIFTICSEPSDNSIFLTSALLVDAIELAGAGLPQGWPSRHILTGTLILAMTESSYFFPLNINKKQIGKTSK